MAADPELHPSAAELLGALPTMVHIELLLLLDRVAPDAVNVDRAADELRSALQLVWVAAEDLAAAGLAQRAARNGDFRLADERPKLRAAIAALREEYDHRPVTLIKALYRRPPDALRAFANSFRLREDT